MDFLPRTLISYMVVHAYLFLSFYRQMGRKRIFLFSFPWFVFMGLFPFVHFHLPDGIPRQIFSLVGTVWLPFAYFCLLAFIAKDILGLFIFFLRRLASPCRNWRLPGLRFTWPGVFVLAVIFAYGTYEARSLKVTHLQVPTTKLGKTDKPLRFIFAADLHIGPQTGQFLLRRSVDRILEQEPDCILLGGDILDDALQGTASDIRELQRLTAPLGTFAVLGNHDAFGGYERTLATLEKTGFKILQGEGVDAGPVHIAGIDDPLVSAQKGEEPQNPYPLLEKVKKNTFTFLLAHEPVIPPGCIGLFDLQLSGHTHGGQIIPLKPFVERKFGTPTGLSRHVPENEEAPVLKAPSKKTAQANDSADEGRNAPANGKGSANTSETGPDSSPPERRSAQPVSQNENGAENGSENHGANAEIVAPPLSENTANSSLNGSEAFSGASGSDSGGTGAVKNSPDGNLPKGKSSGKSTNDERQSFLFVTTGVGFSKLPIRLFVPPEIVVIDLVPIQTK